MTSVHAVQFDADPGKRERTLAVPSNVQEFSVITATPPAEPLEAGASSSEANEVALMLEQGTRTTPRVARVDLER